MPKRAEYLTTGVAPSTPPSGKVAIYAKSASVLAYMGEDGAEHIIGESSVVSFSGAWPVGSIFISAVSTDPNTLLGFGTWQRFGQGRVLVSQLASDTDFVTAEQTGGNKTHTQTLAELFAHTHVFTGTAHNHTQDAHAHTASQSAHNHSIAYRNNGVLGVVRIQGSGDNSADDGNQNTSDVAPAVTVDANIATNQATTAAGTNANTGGSGAMDIMNPYIVVYMWKRTA